MAYQIKKMENHWKDELNIYTQMSYCRRQKTGVAVSRRSKIRLQNSVLVARLYLTDLYFGKKQLCL